MANSNKNKAIKAPIIKISQKFSSKKVKKLVFAFVTVILVVIGARLGYKYVVVARVNGIIIPRRVLTSKLVGMYGEAALEELIAHALVANALKEADVSASEDEVARRITEIESGLGGQNLEEALQSQGLALDEFKRQVALRIGAENLLAENVELTSEEIDAFLEANGDFIQAETDEQKREAAIDILLEQKLQQAISEWIVELRENATVKKYL